MMVAIVTKLKAKSGEEGKLEKALRDVLPKVRAEEGTLVYSLHKKQDDPTTLMVFEKFKDMDALLVHGTAPYVKDMLDTVMPLLDGDMSLEIYEEIA
ncbi:MAG TPA: putative quinol monooxygenase [Dehalococcoidia bacterium]|nr:putative quinol monooxygenase [Dehalococcoidia bacterium]